VKELVLINALLPNVEDHSETVRLDALGDSTKQIVTKGVLQLVYMAAIKKQQHVSHYFALIVKVERHILSYRNHHGNPWDIQNNDPQSDHIHNCHH
jgi:hypothetical protein